jgi:hypothetical protein
MIFINIGSPKPGVFLSGPSPRLHHHVRQQPQSACWGWLIPFKALLQLQQSSILELLPPLLLWELVQPLHHVLLNIVALSRHPVKLCLLLLHLYVYHLSTSAFERLEARI